MGKIRIKKLTPKEVRDIEASFRSYFCFISNVTKTFPNAVLHHDENQNEGPGPEKKLRALPTRLCPARGSEKKPAQTVEELQAKLDQLKGKTSLAYKEKLKKKGLKTRLKKKEKKEKVRVMRLEAKADAKSKKMQTSESKPLSKPVFNNEGNLVFSKFDFSELGAKIDKKQAKVIKDPAVALRKVKEQQEHLKKMEERGEKSKVVEIKEKKAWKTALLKTEGAKIKDDPDLLRAAIKKVKKRKEKSEARWKVNKKRVLKEQEEKQRKRTENLQARSKEKKLKKLKTLAKRGRIIAGF